MALMIKCGVCGAVEKAVEEQVFRATLLNARGQEMGVEVRIPVEQEITQYNKSDKDHVCADCMQQVIKKGSHL